MKDKIKILINRISESIPCCLLLMVQGNVFALTLGHWFKALQVGTLTGLMAVLVSFTNHKELQDNKFVISGLTGFLTAIADLFLHPSHFGNESTEAIVTGIGAGLLCLTLSTIRK